VTFVLWIWCHVYYGYYINKSKECSLSSSTLNDIDLGSSVPLAKIYYLSLNCNFKTNSSMAFVPCGTKKNLIKRNRKKTLICFLVTKKQHRAAA
jgi:hypothetical protein